MTEKEAKQIGERVAALEATVEAGFKYVGERLDNGEKQFGEIQSSISSIRDYVTSRKAVNGWRQEHEAKEEAREEREDEQKAQAAIQSRGKLYDAALIVFGSIMGGGFGLLFESLEGIRGVQIATSINHTQ